MGAQRRADGYLWVATRAGLFRFDGVKYQSVRELSFAALPGVVTPIMCQDRRGRLWLVKDNGVVACVDGPNTRIFTKQDGLPFPKPTSMAEDGGGAIWLAYHTGPLCRIKDGQVQTIDAAADLAGEERVWLAGDSKGQVWFARGNQVGVLRAGRLVPLLTQEQPVTCLTAAWQGGVWFSDGSQIWNYRDGLLDPVGMVPAANVRVLHEDPRGRLWVATSAEGQSSAGLFCYDGHGFRVVPVVCPFIVSLGADREGNLWVGTRRAGLIQVRLRTVELVTPVADVSPDIQSVCEDPSGMRFAVGDNGLLACAQEDGWKLMTAQRGWPGGRVACVAADPRGGVYLATLNQGLFHWRDGRFTLLDDHNFPANDLVRALFVSSTGDLWIGDFRNKKLSRWRDGSLQDFAVPSGNGKPCAMAEDAAGTLWVATVEGLLLRVSGDILVDATPKIPDGPDPIRGLSATPDGSLWIGYASRGLGRLKQGQFCRFGPEQGLEDEAISQMLADDHGWLWCASNRGILRVKLTELEALAAGNLAKLRPVLCGRNEGWPVMQASSDYWPRTMRSRSGELCMAMGTGMAVIRPEWMVDDPPAPAVIIERLSVNGQPVAAYDNRIAPSHNPAGGVAELYGLTDKLSLGRGVHQLGVEYNVVSFAGQDNVRFRYRLNGLDDFWVDARTQRTAYYSQVPPGHYQFRVSACNNEGIWNETGTTLEFTVVPYFWQTTWFRVLSGLAAVGLVGGGVWLETRRRHRHKIERLEFQQAVERERGRIARDMHDDLGSHLTQIVMLSESEQGRSDRNPVADGAWAEINQTARNVTLKMSEIVWALNPAHDSLESFTDYIGRIAHDILGGAGIQCRLDLPLLLPAQPLSSPVRHNVLLAFKEALHNVVKHAKATKVIVSLRIEGEAFVLCVEDDGSGLAVPADAVSHGHGLANMTHRLTEVGGQCQLENHPGGGVCVRFIVPLKSQP